MGLLDCYRSIRFRERCRRKALSAFSTALRPCRVRPVPGTDFSAASRPTFGRRKAKEETMFKITNDDLAKKTDSQLAALFQEVVKGIAPASPDRPAAQSLLAMIAAERAKRGPQP